MATKKAAELFELDVNGLVDALADAKKEHFNLRFQRASGQLENTARVREVRRDIARLKTIGQSKRSGSAKTSQDKPAAAKRARKRATKS